MRSDASKESPEDQTQEVVVAKTESQQAQLTASQVEPEAMQDAASVEQAVTAQEDTEGGPEDAQAGEVSQKKKK